LLRTCDAVGACIAVPDTVHYRAALKHGDTLGPKRAPCIHWVRTSKDHWIAATGRDGVRLQVQIPSASFARTVMQLRQQQHLIIAVAGRRPRGAA
jgi:hypothetical protein